MQVLKDSTREKLELSAIKLFKENGYEKVSMRKIALDADMTVGNIYRYYDNKNHLFESILQPALDEILALVSDEIADTILDTTQQNHEFVSNVISVFLEIHSRHADVLNILVYSCEGSTLDNPAELVSQLLAERFETLIALYANMNNIKLDAQFLARMLCSALVDNFIQILYKFDDDNARRVHMIQITQVYTQLFISGILNDRKEG